MPYYVFRISADKAVSLIDVFEKYPDAKAACRKLRTAAPGDSAEQVRMAFAATEHEAKRLLTDRRQPSSPLEEWEA